MRQVFRVEAMFGRRLVILVAVLMGLTALAASVAPPPETARRDRSASPTPAPTPSEAPPDRAVTGVVSARIEVGPDGGRPARVRARAGNTVVLDVTGDAVDAVVVDDLPVIEAIDPDTPAHLELQAPGPGRYPIKLLDADRQIGVLDVAAG
jgi:hypothetical protein